MRTAMYGKNKVKFLGTEEGKYHIEFENGSSILLSDDSELVWLDSNQNESKKVEEDSSPELNLGLLWVDSIEEDGYIEMTILNKDTHQYSACYIDKKQAEKLISFLQAQINN
jgi:hypothetical protein